MRRDVADIRIRFFAVFSLAIAMLITLGPTMAAGQRTSDEELAIRYEVDLTDSKNHYLTITATIPADGDTTELMMAVWTPGSYLVREYARHIDTMEVTAKGKPLAFEKTKKNRWQVESAGVESFQVKYHLYCNEMTVRTNWVGKQYALINGAPSYITVPSRLDQAHEVHLKLPRNWTRSATSLRSTGDSPNTFRAENFDELVDSPIVAGNISIYPFMVSGVEHQLVNIGESGYWDGTKAATDLKQIVEAHHEMWGVVPYDRYLFLNMICESGGGLEHNNSTVLMTSRWTFRDANRYKGWLSLASHEFFHTWNVRRLRPKSLATYDYENEVYTDSLWIAEGITSYYQDLLVERAGFFTRTEYLGRLSRNVESVQRTHGRKLQSLKDSSYDAWIKYYRQDENSSITQISYYSKGAVAAFLLDAKIRKLTQGEKSLDDLMRKMFKTYSKSGYTTEQFRSTASQIAGEDLSDWFTSTIDSTDELDFSDIDFIGVAVPNQKTTSKPTPEKPADAKTSGRKKPVASKKGANAKTKKKNSGKGKRKTKATDNPKPDAKVKDAAKAKKKPAKSSTRKKKTVGQKKADGKKKTDGKSKSEAKSKATSKSAAKGKQAPKKEASQGSFFGALRSRLRGQGRAPSTTPPPSGGRPWIGLSSGGADGIVTVSGVTLDSPAYEVGLNRDDEIIAINGFRVSRSVDSRLSQYKVGDEIEMLISRRGKLMTFRVTIGSRKTTSWRLRFISRMSDDQESQQERWLGDGESK